MAGDNIFNRSETRVFRFKRHPVIGMAIAVELDENLNRDEVLVLETGPKEASFLEIVSYHGWVEIISSFRVPTRNTPTRRGRE